MTFEELPKPIPVGNAKNLSGMKCGELTILYRIPNTNKTHTRWACVCSCGDYCTRDANDLIKGIGKCDSPHNHNSLVGKKFGKLIPIHRTDDYKHDRGWLYECLCECGNIKKIREKDFVSGKTITCECQKRKYEDLINQRFGRLVVIGQTRDVKNRILWTCRCDCGSVINVTAGALV